MALEPTDEQLNDIAGQNHVMRAYAETLWPLIRDHVLEAAAREIDMLSLRDLGLGSDVPARLAHPVVAGCIQYIRAMKGTR